MQIHISNNQDLCIQEILRAVFITNIMLQRLIPVTAIIAYMRY